MPPRPVHKPVDEPKKVYAKSMAKQPVSAPPPKPKKDIWKPRTKWADSRSVFDTEAVHVKRFEADWARALELGLQKIIMQRDDDGGLDDDGDGICDEVGEVHNELMVWYEPLSTLFDFYACTTGSSICTITLNQWSELIEDLDLEDNRFCRQADMDTLFISVNVASKKADKAQKERAATAMAPAPVVKGGEKTLNRVEFMVCMVHVAIAKYVLTKKIKDVSQAVHALFAEQIEPRVDHNAVCSYNVFRATAYAPKVTEVLLSHETSLRNLFTVAANSSEGTAEEKLLSLDEWKDLLKALQLIGEDVTERDGRLCFACSRMAVVDGWTAQGVTKENNLPFEGFLEALCRLSMLKALPTDTELKLTGCADAGIFMKTLHAGDLPEDYTDALDVEADGLGDEVSNFIATHAAGWGCPSVHTLDRAMYHLMACIIRTVEEDSHGADDMALKMSEVKNWAARAHLHK